MTIRPMLAAKCEDLKRLRFPVLATPKLDGIRCITSRPVIARNKDHQCDTLTRNLKPIPNDFTRLNMEKELRPGLDGELLAHVHNESWPKLPTFQSCSSCIMSHAGWYSFKYFVFDLIPAALNPDVMSCKDPGYEARVQILARLHLPDWCVKVLPVNIPDADHLAAYEAACISEGYEGIMIRTPDSPYKYGRSTFREQWLVKIKRFEDSEAEVLEVIERYTNNNAPEINALGYQERSTHQAGLTPAGDMGALRVRDLKTGAEFQIGTGFDAMQRKSVWTFRSTCVGAILKYKFQPHGVKELPRFPVFVGWRHQDDMS